MRLIAEKTIYENNIKKYLAHKKRNDFLIRISTILYGGIWFLFLGCGFSALTLLVVFIFEEVPTTLSIITTSFAAALFVDGLLVTLVEFIKVEPSWRDKIWLADVNNEIDGYHLNNVEIWLDADKIFSHLIYIKEESVKQFFCRLDEFSITKCDDNEEPFLDLDNFILHM